LCAYAARKHPPQQPEQGQALRLRVRRHPGRAQDPLRHLRVHVARDGPEQALRLQDRRLGAGHPPVRNDLGQGSLQGQLALGSPQPDEDQDLLQRPIQYLATYSASEEINLIKSILRVTPHKRPTIKEILDHPYFSDPETLSTKESELDTSRLDSSMARHLPETKK
jgi:serine/threonine protein kinase